MKTIQQIVNEFPNLENNLWSYQQIKEAREVIRTLCNTIWRHNEHGSIHQVIGMAQTDLKLLCTTDDNPTLQCGEKHWASPDYFVKTYTQIQ